MDNTKAIALLRRMQEPEAYEPQITAEAFDALGMAIKALEQASFPQRHENDHVPDTNVGDTISRQAALKCFHDWIDKHGDVHTADEMPEYEAIENLPSAQPELIRCKDCKYYYAEPSDPDWGRCNCSAWYDGDGGDQLVSPTDYCSFAERKEGTDG